MIKPNPLDSSRIQDNIKQTLLSESKPIKIYDWMLDAHLRQADLFLYAYVFDYLRDTPRTPKPINISEVARKMHYTRVGVIHSMNRLVDAGFLYEQGVRSTKVYSLYPFYTLNLK